MGMSLNGGTLSRHPVALSDDGQVLLAPCGHSIKIFAAVTGQQCGQLDGHTAEVTCVALNPTEPSQAVSASLDGTLRLWDHAAGTCLHVYVVREAVRYMVLHAHLSQAYLSIDWRDGQSGRVISFSLLKGRAGASAMKTRAPGPLAMQPRGTLVATIDRHSLFVWRAGPEISQPLNLHHTKPYTCLAISSDESVLAAGDVSGRILIWRDLALAVPQASRTGVHSGKQQLQVPPVLSTLHWHAGPVGCLAFSTDTTYLRSGGQEGVLVTWQLDNNRPQFLPRLGGAIVGLSHCTHDPALLLLRQADNTLRLVNLATNQVSASEVSMMCSLHSAEQRPPPPSPQPGHLSLSRALPHLRNVLATARSSEVESSVLGLRPAAPGCSPAASALATSLQPGSGLLTLPTSNATLQLYDVQHHRHVALLQVAARNEVSATEGEGAPQVAHSVYTHDGCCLATVDLRLDAGPYGAAEASLKFWDAVPGTGKAAPFVLNTIVDDPHRGPITCVAAHPSQALFVTAGGGSALQALDSEDSLSLSTSVGSNSSSSEPEFKVWERVDAARRPGSKLEAPTCWRCRSVGTFKGLLFTAAAFSPDGSLLALAAQSKVTLWDPLTNSLVGVLPTPAELLLVPEGSPPRLLRTLAFCVGTHYLVGSSGSVLAVWDLLRMTVHWSVALPSCSLAADPVHPLFAVALPITGGALTQAAEQVLASSQGPPAVPPTPVAQPIEPVAAGANDTQQGATVQTPAPQTGRRTRRSAAVATATAGSQAEQEGQAASQAQATQQLSKVSQQPALDSTVTSAAQPSGTPTTVAQARLAKPISGPECHVVVFNPASPRPVLACCVRDTGHMQLLFVAPGMPPNQQGTGRPSLPGVPAISPLLLLTADRGYELVGTDRGAEGAKAVHIAPTKAVSAYEAAFGAFKSAPEALLAVPDIEAGQGPRWRALLDAPSHALPPPTLLASAFMRLLVAESRPE